LSASSGFAVRAVDTSHGYPDKGKCQVSVGKATPQTATANLFTVTGTIVCSLVGVISTVLGAVAQHLNVGVTGSPTAIAANSTVALNATAAGAVIAMPQVLGGALPAPVIASGTPAGAMLLQVSNTSITLTSDASTTGNITWILSWVPLFPKKNASVVTN
jgi:hypothetical protein